MKSTSQKQNRSIWSSPLYLDEDEECQLMLMSDRLCQGGCSHVLPGGNLYWWIGRTGPLCQRCYERLSRHPYRSPLTRIAAIHDVPEDVCPQREAVSGAVILWVFVFAVIAGLICYSLWGWSP